MIVLDTNVISALMQSNPDQMIIDWLDTQTQETIWTTSISVFEIRFGIEILQAGQRKRILSEAFEQSLDQDFERRILNFDLNAAHQTARIAAELRAVGRPVEIRDVQIAGIVAAHQATLATRNLRHFINTGITLVNPWDYQET